MNLHLIKYNNTNEYAVLIPDQTNVRLMDKIKSLPNIKYHPRHNCWSTPLRMDVLLKLKQWGGVLDKGLREYLYEKSATKTKNIQNLNYPIYMYQWEGVQFLKRNKGRVLIADEMGLGKTIQCIAWMCSTPDVFPILIVCPSILKLNWKAEIEKWTQLRSISVINGSSQGQDITSDIVIINYDILNVWKQKLKIAGFKTIIVDECHFIKNNSAQRTKALRLIAKYAKHVICLSGTPVLNRPAEIYNSVKLINPNIFPNQWHFFHRYCGARHNGFGWDFSGASNVEELHNILAKNVMIRRRKQDVLHELPPKIRTLIPLPIDNQIEYNYAEQDFIKYLIEKKGLEKASKASNAEMLTKIEELKTLAVRGKIKYVFSFIDSVLQNEDKVVVFGIHRFVVEALFSHYNGICVRIDGSTSTKQREHAIYNFQNNKKIKLFVGNMDAAGIGITLTASRTVIIIELPWTPGKLVQAEDRCHRITQLNTNATNIYYLLAHQTIEYKKIAPLLINKIEIANQLIDGGGHNDNSLLNNLLENITS